MPQKEDAVYIEFSSNCVHLKKVAKLLSMIGIQDRKNNEKQQKCICSSSLYHNVSKVNNQASLLENESSRDYDWIRLKRVSISRARNKLEQWRCQNVKKVTHIKGRLLIQTVILFNCVSFHNGNFS